MYKSQEMLHLNVEEDSFCKITTEDIVKLTDYIEQKCPDKYPEDLTLPPRETIFLTIIVPGKDDP